MKLRIALMASLCAVLAFTHVFRMSEYERQSITDVSRDIYVLERHVAFGETGPTLRDSIKREDWLALRETFTPDVTLVPFSVVDRVVRSGNGHAVPIRVIDVGGAIPSVMQDVSKSSSDSCDHARIEIDRRLQDRLGLVPGHWVDVGDVKTLVGSGASVAALRLIPGIAGVNAIRCVVDSFAEPTRPVEQALLLAPSRISENELLARLARLNRDDGTFRETWQLTHRERAAELAGQRKFGWIGGVECLLAMLAMGTLVLLRAFEQIKQGADPAIRRVLGERWPHRVMRYCVSGLKESGWILLCGTLLMTVVVSLVSERVPIDMPKGELLVRLLRVLTAMAGIVFILRLMSDLVLSATPGRQPMNQASMRISQHRRPAVIAAGLAAFLCGAICVPGAFMVAEFNRHAGMSPGYTTKGLYAARLVLLDYEVRDQAQWWDRLMMLRSEIGQIPGVTSAGYITHAPWDFAGSKGVVGNEDQMILNVGLSAGVLGMLSPSGWNGREMTDQQEQVEAIVQNLEDGARESFIPSGTTIIGEVHGLRYSPLDETGRSAIFRSLRTGIGHDVNVLVEAAGNEATVIDGLNAALARHGEIFAAAPVASVDRILADRLMTVRTSAVISMGVASIAIFLLAITLLMAIRLYVALNRRDLSIRLCLGASLMRIQTRLLGRSLISIGAGWALGTLAGLVLWHQIVVLIQDHRLLQPWSSLWLWLAAMLLVTPYVWLLARSGMRKISLSDALKA